MKLTGIESGFYPAWLVRAAKAKLYRPQENIYRVTELTDAPIIRTLKLEKWNEIEWPIDKQLPALLGTSWDMMLEKYIMPEDKIIHGMRLWLPAKYDEKTIYVTGEWDEYKITDYTISDRKTASVWKWRNNDWADYTAQVNLYALLAEKYGFEVNKLQLYVLFKDFSDTEKLREANYPPARHVRIEVPLWPKEQREEYLINRIEEHIKFPYRYCTQKERWQNDSKWAVMKRNQPRAIRLLDTKDELHAYCIEKGILLNGEHYIEERPANPKRCNEWCPVKPWCPKWTNNQN